MSGSENERTGRLIWLGLALTVILAAALRVWGIEYGVSHPTVRPDEERIVGRAYTILATGDPSPVTYTYPGLMMYLNTLALGLYSWFGQLRGHYDTTFDFLFDAAVLRPGLEFVVCRVMSMSLGVATVVATFFVARDGYRSALAGVLAAACLATNYLHVRASHFATVDIGMTFFVTLALLFAVRASREPSLKNYLLAGLFAGAATAAKYNAALVIFALGAVSVSALFRDPDRKGAAFRHARRVFAAVAVMAVVFAMLSPYSILYYRAAITELATVRQFLSSGPELGAWIHLSVTLPHGFGWPFFLIVMVAIARAIWLRRPADLALLAFLGAFFLHIGTLNVVYPRYVLPLAPLLSVLAAELLVSALGGKRRVLLAGAAVVLVAPGLVKSIRLDRLLARPDTRLVASRWIEENLPPRTSILVCRGYGAPVINTDRRRPPAFEPIEIPCSLRAVREAEASYLVTHEHPVLWGSPPLSADLVAFLEDRGSSMVQFDPFHEDFGGTPYYFSADSFYLPFTGLGSVGRGGPKITIWRLTPEGELPSDRGEPTV